MGITIYDQKLSWEGEWGKKSSMNKIIKTLKANHNITTLELLRHKIVDSETKLLAAYLKTNIFLTRLNLHDNQIRAAGAKAIAEALKINTSLEGLLLHYNQIGETGAEALIKALKTNTSLTEIYLHTNQLENSKSQEIKRIITNNKIIQNSQAGQAFYDALETRTDITKFTLVRKADSLPLEYLIKWLREGNGKHLTTLNIVSKTITSEVVQQLISECDNSDIIQINGIDPSSSRKKPLKKIYHIPGNAVSVVKSGLQSLTSWWKHKKDPVATASNTTSVDAPTVNSENTENSANSIAEESQITEDAENTRSHNSIYCNSTTTYSSTSLTGEPSGPPPSYAEVMDE